MDRMRERRPNAIAVALVLALPAVVPAQIVHTGVNLAGAEFGQNTLPGTFGVQYTYPTNAEVDYFLSKGMTTFRLPFRWERLQPTANGALNTAEVARIDAFVNYATSHGAHVILDPHNYARYYPQPPSAYQNSTTGVIGGDVPNSVFANFWSRVADRYKSNDRVTFNLMNEPANMNTDQWVGAANAAIAAIRQTGAANLIMVPGNRYTGAWTWFNSDANGRSNAVAMLDIVDPGSNFAIEVHQYMDPDGSGTSSGINNNDPMTGVLRLNPFTQWLRQNNRRGFLGEFAVANSTIGSGGSQIGDETLVNMLDFIHSNDDVWMGWSWWAGGPWWPGGPGNPGGTPYMFLLDPANLGQANQLDKPAMGVLQQYVVGVPEPASLVLVAVGGLGFALAKRRRSGR
jgi:endoglucanase